MFLRTTFWHPGQRWKRATIGVRKGRARGACTCGVHVRMRACFEQAWVGEAPSRTSDIRVQASRHGPHQADTVRTRQLALRPRHLVLLPELLEMQRKKEAL